MLMGESSSQHRPARTPLAPESCTHTSPSRPASWTGQETSAPSSHPSWRGGQRCSLCAVCSSPESDGLRLGQSMHSQGGSAHVSVHLRARGRSGPRGASVGTPAREGQGPEADSAAHPARCRGLEPAPVPGKDGAPHQPSPPLEPSRGQPDGPGA